MKEKDKAKELIAYYRYALSLPNAPLGDDKHRVAKQCALICIDEIIAEYASLHGGLVNAILRTERVVYWQRVRTEIEAL